VFTGIVEELGTVAAKGPGGLEIGCAVVLDGTEVGDSISVNGCCLTVTERRPDAFSADVMAETLRRTSLGALEPGSPVNLERALAAGDRFGGHIVQGHVDAAVEVLAVEPDEQWTTLRVALPAEIAAYVAEKGSITLDGVSLTVAGVDDGSFVVALIPHTLDHTTLGQARAGTRLNLEIDVIAKYVGRLLSSRKD
jgi:riboflavin synthase